ncbi:PGF-pre-PGF domain protein [Halolamina pelagica]|uniref:PGF-pre-PGF domain protein n=1 Tax=Halolamina pelagica TaxID=699431 RepID=A0A0P7I2T4_9EURY|nr:PGF-pre-PGF domain-containing protein [Halolamina pelagica]KPN31213.1 PGF-pre-PGF domain protein [Halolamina pelagica]
MTNRRTIALALTLVVAGSFAFPSTAASLFAGPTDQIGDEIELAPSSDYAYLDADDELVVDLSPTNPDLDAEGVNADGRTTIQDVFRIRYDGSQYAHVWLTHGSDAVTFAVDGQPIQSEANNVTLAPNESVAVSLTVDTTGRADGFVDDITIHSLVAEPETVAADTGGGNTGGADTADTSETPSIDGFAKRVTAPTEHSRRFVLLSGDPGSTEFNASRLALDPSGALTLDRISTTSENRSYSLTADTSGVGAAESVVVDAGAEPLGAVQMTVDSGTISGATMEFSAAKSFVAEREVEMANLAVYRYADGSLTELDTTATGERDNRLTFEAETPGFSTFVVAVKHPQLALSDADLSATTVAPGERVTVTASVSNNGTLAGNRTLTVRVNDEIAATRTVEVAPGATETVTVPVVRNETGEYTVSVDGVETGSFTVVAEDTPQTATVTETTAPPSTASATDTPVAEPGGFGLESLLGLVGLLAILAMVLVLARRTPGP